MSIKYTSLNECICKGCGGTGGHSTYEETLGEMMYHQCDDCEGTGYQE